MSDIARSCLQCRLAKVKCDFARPRCGRCKKRGTVCDGYRADGEFVFRDETWRAQRLSRRARGAPREEDEDEEVKPAAEDREASSSPPSGPWGRSQAEVDRLRPLLPWLNSRALAALPTEVLQDSESRALELFFAHWVVRPSASLPGYMHHLPQMHQAASPASVLHPAIHAIALADLRRVHSQTREYEARGLESYSNAIVRLREVISEPQSLVEDDTLAAILLIDAFETIYLGRDEPLGLHDKALNVILEARGTDQLYSERRFCLTRLALYRLQARQLLLGEDSGVGQRGLIESLNDERLDLHILRYSSQIVQLCSKAEQLISRITQEQSEQSLVEISFLLQAIEQLLSANEAWFDSLDPDLKPKLVQRTSPDPAPIDQDTEMSDDPVHTFPCPATLQHQDITLAFLWSFSAAAQIILRSHTIRTLRAAAHLSPGRPQKYSDKIAFEELAIHGLSSSIIRTFPKMMGFDVDRSPRQKGPWIPSQASSLGRFLGMFALVVVVRTEATSQYHKASAERVLAWVQKHHEPS